MAIDENGIRCCLGEIDRELFRLAETDECRRFHNETQFTAVLLLLLRASSLIRPLLSLLESRYFDGFDAVLRSFEETWYLAHELRLVASEQKARRWLAEEPNTWKAHIRTLVEFAQQRGHPGPNLGRDYNLLSELAHPTKSAAMNSVTLVALRMGIDGAAEELGEAQDNDEKRVGYALYRLAWLMLDGDASFLAIHANEGDMQNTSRFVNEYEDVEPGE